MTPACFAEPPLLTALRPEKVRGDGGEEHRRHGAAGSPRSVPGRHVFGRFCQHEAATAGRAQLIRGDICQRPGAGSRRRCKSLRNKPCAIALARAISPLRTPAGTASRRSECGRCAGAKRDSATRPARLLTLGARARLGRQLLCGGASASS